MGKKEKQKTGPDISTWSSSRTVKFHVVALPPQEGHQCLTSCTKTNFGTDTPIRRCGKHTCRGGQPCSPAFLYSQYVGVVYQSSVVCVLS